MDTNQQTEVLAAIAELWRHHPDWRLGQLVANVAGWTDIEIWDVEDEQLIEAVRQHLLQLKERLHADRLKVLEELARQAQELKMGY
jgi:NADPH-dependent curcumin reductase CurA